MLRAISVLGATIGLALLPVPAEVQAQRSDRVKTAGDIERERLSTLAKTDPAAAEREALAKIAALEAGEGLGSELAKDIGDALRSIYADQRRDADQIALLERYQRANEARFGPDYPATLDWAIRLGHDLEGMERYDEAERWFLRNHAARRRLNSRPSEETQDLLIQAARALANFYGFQQRWDKAEAFWLEAIAVSGAKDGEAHERTLEWMSFLARSYQSAGQTDKQIALLKRAIELARIGGKDTDGYSAKRYSKELADALTDTGQRDEALVVVDEVVDYDKRTADDIFGRLSNVRQRQLLMTAGRFDEVEKLLLADMRLIESEGEEDKRIIPISELAAFHDELAQYDRAETYWRQAIALDDADSDPYFELSRQGFARSLTLQGRYAEAEQVWREIVRRYKSPVDEDPRTSHIYVGHLVELAGVLRDQGRAKEAEDLLLDTLGRGQHDDTVEDARDMLGRIYVEQGRDEEALAIFQRLRDQSARLVGDAGLATVSYDAQIAEIRAKGGAQGDLLRIYEQNARAFRTALGDNDRLTRSTVRRLASLYSKVGRLAEAHALLDGQRVDLTVRDAETFDLRNQLALLRWQQGEGREAVSQLAALSADTQTALGASNPSTLIYASNAAEVALREGLFDEALPLTRQLAAGLDEQRIAMSEQLSSDAQLAPLTEQGEGGYKLLADAAWSASADGGAPQQGRRGEAFAALQNAMTSKTDRDIARSVARRMASAEGGALAEAIRRIEAVQQSRDGLTRAITASFADRSEAAFRLRTQKVRERDALTAEFKQLDAELRRLHPDYFALVRADPVTVDAVGKVLAPEEALLLIVPGPRGTHVMAVADGQLHWHRSALDSDAIDKAVRRLLFFLRRDPQPVSGEGQQWLEAVDGGRNGFDRNVAWNLFRELIAPAAARLEGKTRLIVAAGGALASLPLSVLVTAPPTGDGSDPQVLRDTPWLADRFAMVQVPSIQSFAFLRARRDTAGQSVRRFVGFGDPLLGESRERDAGPSKLSGDIGQVVARGAGGNSIAIDKLHDLGSLPGTAEELNAMARLFGDDASTLMLAEQSTEANVKRADLSTVDVLAFATHALTAGEVRGAAEPGLVLTPPAAASALDDGYLGTSEVAQLRLSADWVILSACNTASGDGSVGSRGLSGLARSFFYAGAGNLLASHWPVRDDVTAKLTVRIIEIARDNPGLSRADAFKQAMRETRLNSAHDGLKGVQQSWAHPNAWAPFTLIGDGR